MTSQIQELFDSNKFTQIIAFHKEMETITTLSAEDQIRVVASYFRNNNYNEAVGLVELIAPFQVGSPDYLNLAAVCYRKIGNSKKAYNILNEAENIDPTSIQIQSNMANVLLDLGNIEKAKSILLKILDEYPEFEDAKVNLARANILSQHLIDKTASISLEYSNDPLLFAFEQEIVDKDMKRFLPTNKSSNKNDSTKSKNKIDEILSNTDNFNDNVNEKVRLSTIANSNNNIDESLELSSIVHNQENEVNPNVLANISDSYIKKMRFKEAEIYAMHSIMTGEGSPEIYLNLCTLCTLRSDYKLAKYYLNKTKIMDPSHSNIDMVEKNLNTSIEQDPQPIKFQNLWSKENDLRVK